MGQLNDDIETNDRKRSIQTIAPFLTDDFVDLNKSIFDTEKFMVFLDNKLNTTWNL